MKQSDFETESIMADNNEPVAVKVVFYDYESQCDNCGATIKRGWLFCPLCGSPIKIKKKKDLLLG